jgi:hypothetical protein
MLEQFERVCLELDQVVTQVGSVVPNDAVIGIAHSNWSFPAVTKRDLKRLPERMAQKIRQANLEEASEEDLVRLAEIEQKLAFLRQQTISQLWSSPAAAVTSYMETMRAIEEYLDQLIDPIPAHIDLAGAITRLRRQITGMEARATNLEPRTNALTDLVEKLEAARDAADQLPTDLAELDRARNDVTKLRSEAERDLALISSRKDEADDFSTKILHHEREAYRVLELAGRAYSASTSQGLASAFSERSKSLTISMALWTAGLVLALWAGFFFGTEQIKALNEVIRTPGVAPSFVMVSALLALLSVAAPVWFAWLATKQVSQSFRLAEDYAFKAAVSRAYEGYRREAANMDAATATTDMEARLLGSALARFDEQPLRVVDPNTPGSPWHELMSSNAVRDAIRSVPTFIGSVKDLASRSLLRSEGPGRAGSATPKTPEQG